ncbi:MAG: FG-GAP-like repeat-containing protein, partial [bacterium]
IKILDLGNDRISVNYNNTGTRIFNFGDNNKNQTLYNDVPTFTFNLANYDTSLYSYMFPFWQEIPLATNQIAVPLLSDVNNNNLTELYGYKKEYYLNRSEVWCYEQDFTGKFKPVYKYPENTSLAYNIYDVDRDGDLELHLVSLFQDSLTYEVHNQSFFKKPAADSLATHLYFNYNIYTNNGFNIQLNDFTFGDFDNDDTTDVVYFGISPLKIHIAKYNELNLTYDSVLTYPTYLNPIWESEYISGFTVGDFDMDNKTDIVYASEYGNIYMLENEGEDKYKLKWKDNYGIWNSYIGFRTNDIDGNGKPEIWVGGENFPEDVSKLVCLETDGNNSFKPVAFVNFPYLLSLNNISGMSMDIDNDGKEEIFINIGNTVVVLKFSGSKNNPNYEVCYLHRFVMPVDHAVLYNFYNQNYPTIVLSMSQSIESQTREFTQMYRHYLLTDVKENEPENLLTEYKLFANYPNPFNPSTNIKFALNKTGNVKLKIYNSLGEEIITLIDKLHQKGEHTVVWNGKNQFNKNAPSGVYFITMEAENFQKTIKCLLMK